jgi:hypothetical protein
MMSRTAARWESGLEAGGPAGTLPPRWLVARETLQAVCHPAAGWPRRGCPSRPGWGEDGVAHVYMTSLAGPVYRLAGG